MPPSRHLARLLHVWETFQVELHGRYSLARLHDLIDHVNHSTKLKDLAMILVTPLPCLAVLIFMELLPINPPELGFANQTVWLFVRLWLLVALLTFMSATQIHQSSPTLPLSTTWRAIFAVVIATVCTILFCIVSTSVVFPVPFLFQMLSLPMAVLFVPVAWFVLKDALRTDPEAKQRLLQYAPAINTTQLLQYAYPFFNVAFTTASPAAQPFVSLALPMMKLIFKNVMSKGVFHMEDLAPTTIVFNLDVFHAIFVSSSMQQAHTGSSTAVIMLVDLLQSLVALYEIHLIMRRVARLESQYQLLQRGKAESAALLLGSSRALRRGPIAYALFVLDNTSAVRKHPEIVHARHLRVHTTRAAKSIVSRSFRMQLRGVMPMSARMPSSPAPSLSQILPRPIDRVQPELTPTEELQLECVKRVLQMLHMIEFYVLTEFAELLVAFTYTVYMAVVSHLPNRAYYWQLEFLSDAELDTRVNQLVLYTALELLSFVGFCCAVDRQVRYFSTIRQLAFVLRKHVLTVQPAIFMWVLYIVQLSFKHFGADFTFRFAWLRQSAANSGH